MPAEFKNEIIPKPKLIEHCMNVLGMTAHDATKTKNRKDIAAAKQAMIMWTSIIHHLKNDTNAIDNNQQADAPGM